MWELSDVSANGTGVPVLDGAAVRRAFARRAPAAHGLTRAAPHVAAVCREMAARFARGGKLIVFGNGESGADASHVAVEFMHPVVVGKRALPALALGNDSATLSGVGSDEGFAEVFAHPLRAFADAGDIALALTPDGRCANVRRGLAAARERGLLTVVLSGGDPADAPPADHTLVVGSADPLIVKEVQVTVYHVLWEMTHVFLEAPGDDGTCDTCADRARPMRVRQLLPNGLALAVPEADDDGPPQEISVALVDAAAGCTVLVHGGEAIAMVTTGASDE